MGITTSNVEKDVKSNQTNTLCVELFNKTAFCLFLCIRCGPVLPTLKCYNSSKPLNSATYVSALRAVDPHHQHRSVSTANSGLPEPPKRPLAPFIKFANEKREQVKKANPGEESFLSTHKVRRDIAVDFSVPLSWRLSPFS